MGTVNIEIMLKGDAIMKENKKIIPIFYACDTNYLPYLSVSLISLKKHANDSISGIDYGGERKWFLCVPLQAFWICLWIPGFWKR